jgi:hypothetical protein
MPMFVFAGAMQLTQRALKILNFAFVVNFLALGEFQRFEHFLHFIERVFEFVDDPVDLLDRVTDGGRPVRFLLLTMPGFRAAFFALRFFAGPFLVVTFFLMPFFLVALFVVLPLLDGFHGCVGGFGGRSAGRGGFAGSRGGQGTARFAAARVAPAPASGTTPASGCSGITLFRCGALLCFVRRHADRLPRGT